MYRVTSYHALNSEEYTISAMESVALGPINEFGVCLRIFICWEEYSL